MDVVREDADVRKGMKVKDGYIDAPASNGTKCSRHAFTVYAFRNVEIDIAPAAAGGEIAVLRPRLEVALDGDGGRNQTAHQTVEALHTSRCVCVCVCACLCVF